MLLKKRVDAIDFGIGQAFVKIREEFSEHLQAINENTNEIQANYEYLCEMDAKIDKLAEKLDEIALFIKHPHAVRKQEFSVAPLTKSEQEVFQSLYALVHEKGNATYLDIGRRCGLTEELVQSYVQNLIEKGVPVQKKYLGSHPLLSIDHDFCELQAKENILGISEIISEKIIS